MDASKYMLVKVEEIAPSRFQARTDFDLERIAGLALDIKAQGLLHPVTLRQVVRAAPIKYELVAGECRLRAFIMNNEPTIPAFIYETLSDAQAKIMGMAENIQRQNLRPLEESRAVAIALEENTIEDVAAAFGKTAGWISKRVQLQKLSARWKREVEKGIASNWPADVLVEIARMPETLQSDFFDRIHYSGMPTVKTIREYLCSNIRVLSSAAFSTSDCLKCQSCTAASPELFSEDINLKKGDRCLDKQCWQRKTKACLETAFIEAKKENEKILTVTTEGEQYLSYDDPIRNNALEPYQFAEVKPTAKGAIEAFVVDGKEAGKKIFIKPKEHTMAALEKKAERATKSMKQKREELNTRRVMLAIKKAIEELEHMEAEKATFTYNVSVPLVIALGAYPLSSGMCMEHSHSLIEKSKLKDMDIKTAQRDLAQCVLRRVREGFEQMVKWRCASEKAAELYTKWCGITWEKLLKEATIEIPEPKSWAKEKK